MGVDPASRFTMAEKDKKLVIIGDGAVGKTCLMDVFEKGEFVEMPYRPTVFHNSFKMVEHPTTKEQFSLQLWDTAGQEEYAEARKSCYEGTSILLIGFSLVEPDSLANVAATWEAEAKLDKLRGAPRLLVGLKADLKNDDKIKEDLAKRNEEPVTEEAAKKMADKIEAKGYFETSAKNNQGVQELFAEAIKLACAQKKLTDDPGCCCVIA